MRASRFRVVDETSGPPMHGCMCGWAMPGERFKHQIPFRYDLATAIQVTALKIADLRLCGLALRAAELAVNTVYGAVENE
jgi:hypothetical protein